MDAVNPIDQFNETKRIQQSLRDNPKDIESQLKLAALTKDPEDKRKILNVVLSQDPTNKSAREMLLELDRAAIDAGQTIPLDQMSAPLSSPSINEESEKALVFRYSFILQAIVYAVVALAVNLWFRTLSNRDVVIVSSSFLLSMIIPLWSATVVAKVSGAGLTVSRLFGVIRWEVPWNEIEQITLFGRKLGIQPKGKRMIQISPRIRHYDQLVEVLINKRPDLFDASERYALGYRDRKVVTGPQSGGKVFQQNSFVKLVNGFGLVVMVFLSLGTLVAQPLVGIVAIAVTVILWLNARNTIHTVTLQGDTLYTKSNAQQSGVTAQQIQEISIRKIRRKGINRYFVYVEVQGGGGFRLEGFSVGYEALYKSLVDWWKTQRNKSL